MPEIGDEAAYNRALLEHATYGLSALETLVDDLESRLTAARAGYLDNLNNSELAVLARYQRSQQVIFGDGTGIAAGLTRYLACWTTIFGASPSLATEWTFTLLWLVTKAGTIKNLVCASGSAPGAGESYVYTVRKNGVDQTLTVTISGSTAKLGSNTTNTVSVVVGDYITVKIVTSSGAANDKHLAFIDFEG